MAAISTDDIKKLRELSGAGMMDCKKALAETEGDIEQAAEALRKKGLAKASKRMDRETAVGRVVSYIHGEGSIGVLVQLNCETDFVARNEDFEALGRDIAMQIAAQNPLAIRPEELDQELIEKESAIHREQLEKEGKPADVIEKILPGKLKKYYSEVCLLEQPFIKDDKQRVKDIVEAVAKELGDSISVARFHRVQMGE